MYVCMYVCVHIYAILYGCIDGVSSLIPACQTVLFVCVCVCCHMYVCMYVCVCLFVCVCRCRTIVKLLVKHGADVTTANKYGRTPLAHFDMSKDDKMPAQTNEE